LLAVVLVPRQAFFLTRKSENGQGVLVEACGNAINVRGEHST